MANERVWCFCAAGPVVSLADAALAALGLPGLVPGSLAGQFPLASPQVRYAGWQGTTDLCAAIKTALATVVGAHVFPGAVYGDESDDSPGVVQEAEVSGATITDPAKRYSRRACLKIVYGRLLFGAPPAG
ncbi:MAG TPA: hypothetical protein VFS43_17760 [Polyangiaceae bacterium]|nr:hypothetical protein [Polyangiaceae bacterium]